LEPNGASKTPGSKQVNITNLGYADIFKLCGDDASAALIPTTQQLEAAFAAGKESWSAGDSRRARGVIDDLDEALGLAFAAYVSGNDNHPDSEL
jgi:hypothetical protein